MPPWPPTPDRGDGRRVDPPDPAVAERASALVAKAGYEVYEGGGGLFAQPVLVFLGESGKRASEFLVCDHVGQVLGRTLQTNGWVPGIASPTELRDNRDATLLRAEPLGLNWPGWQVGGSASALFAGPMSGTQELMIGRDRELFGRVTGFGFGGRPKKLVRALDHREAQVAELWTFENRRAFRVNRVDKVLSIDPKLGGDYRRLLTALPMILDQIRHGRRR